MNYLIVAFSGLVLIFLNIFSRKLGQRYIDEEGLTPRVRRIYLFGRICLIIAIFLLAIFLASLIFHLAD